MTKKRSGSSRRERLIRASELFTTTLSPRELRELKQLARKSDSEIDTSDAPPVKTTPKRIHVGRFHRPAQRQISLKIDTDVLAWFEAQGKEYQAHMNEALRREMTTAQRH